MMKLSTPDTLNRRTASSSICTRQFGLDVLRALAIVSVIGGHFFMNTPFGRTPVNSASMFIQNALQYLLTTIGVPLFLMLTGYLNCFKQINASYFPKVIRVVTSYLLISVITYAVLIAIGEEVFSFKRLLNGLGDFSIIRYGWYIDMYLGLFLLIPLLNIVIDTAVKDIANRHVWIWMFVGFIMVSSLPLTLNRYGFTLFPKYWKNCWVLDYYIFGALIRRFFPECPPEIFRKLRPILWFGGVGLCVVHPALSMILRTDNPVAPLGGSSDIPGMVLTIIVFLSLYDIKSTPCKTVVSSVARCSLDMYLFSYIVDRAAYPLLMQLCNKQSEMLLYYLPVVACIIFCAWLLSWVKERVFRLLKLPAVWG